MTEPRTAEYDRNFVRGTGDRIGRGGPGMGRDNAPPPPPVIDYARLPTAGPFVCFVGNLPFDVTEDHVRSCFPDVSIIGVKIPKDPEQRGRGFAYIDLRDQDSLIKALLVTGAQLKGRYIRVDISEGRPGQQERAFASDWRSGVEHQVSDRPGRGGYGGGPERVFDRSTMAPVVAEPRGGLGGGTGAWRTTAQPVSAERPKSAISDASFNSTASSAAPKKPVLNLLPRTKPLNAEPEKAQVYSEKANNPFGAAKPIDKAAAQPADQTNQ